MKFLIGLIMLSSLTLYASDENIQEVESDIQAEMVHMKDKKKTQNFLKSFRSSRKDFKKLMKEDPTAKASADRIKKLQNALVTDQQLQARLSEIMSNCSADQTNCNIKLEAFIVEVAGPSVEGSAQPGNIMGSMKGTFGICSVNPETKGIHTLVYGRRDYNCKLSTGGLVFDRSVTRKNYGPGLYRAKHSVLLACSGNAFNTTNVGASSGVGLYYGLALGTTFGKGGICLYIGLGKALGAYAGVEVLKFN